MDWGDFIERQRHRDWPIAVAVLVLLALAFGAFRLERPVYGRWKARRELLRARAFLARGDTDGARIPLEIAARGERTAETYDTLADFYERLGSDGAILARRRAAELAPADLSRRLALARTALRFNDQNTAAAVLEGCSAAEKRDPAYQRTAVACDFLSGDWPGALRRLEALGPAVRADPELRLLRDAIELKEPQPANRAAAASDLVALAALPAQRAAALRVLLADAFARRRPEAALAAGQALAGAPGAGFGDWLDAAAAERLGRPATGADPALLARIRARASADPAAGATYARWLWAEDGPAAAAAWLGQAPPAWRNQPAIRTELAREAAGRGDWAGLRALLAAGAWGPISGATLDLAFAARVASVHGSSELAREAWAQAVEEAGAAPLALEGLARLAAAWQWPEAERAALMAGVRVDPGNAAVFRGTAELLRDRRDSRGLLEVAAAAGGDAAGDEARQEDWATLSLLVAPPDGPNAATRLLASLHAHAPANAYYTTNYAFALWRLGQFAQACALADSLSAADRLLAARAPYLAVIYAFGGRASEARAVLARAPPARALLPEEAALLDQAHAKLAP